MKNLIVQVLNLYILILFIRVIVSWMRINQYNPFIQILYKLTEPVLAPIRRVMPYMGGIDISPIIVLLIINFLIKPLILRF